MSYPEHEKVHAVKRDSQAIGEFIEWLEGHGYFICERAGSRSFWPTMKRLPNALLAEYFEIDEKKLDDEKRAMLDRLRDAQVRPPAREVTP